MKLLSQLLLVLLIVPVSSMAQVNTEKMRLDDLAGWSGSVGGSFSLTGGNAEIYNLGGRVKIDYRKGRNDGFVVGTLRFLQQGDVVGLKSFFGHLRYNYDYQTWFTQEWFTQYEFDEIRLLERRILVGTGLRIKVYKTKQIHLYVGTTPMLEHEELDQSIQDEDRTVTVGRWSNYFSFKGQPREDIIFVNIVYVQPRFDDFGDFRILNETGLTIQLFKHVSLGVNLNLRHDTDPPGALKKTDFTLLNTLSFTL